MWTIALEQSQLQYSSQSQSARSPASPNAPLHVRLRREELGWLIPSRSAHHLHLPRHLRSPASPPPFPAPAGHLFCSAVAQAYSKRSGMGKKELAKGMDEKELA